jgi:hypothetical protein
MMNERGRSLMIALPRAVRVEGEVSMFRNFVWLRRLFR